MPEVGAAELLAGVVLVALTFYVLFGGADFGGGVWDLLASGPRKAAQRALIADSIGPVWEANHVWLILVVVILFTCFPPAFARLSVTLHLPLTLMLVGIVARGSAFTFRSYDRQDDDVQRRWGMVFAIASVVTPVFLGMCVGTIAMGHVPPAPSGTFVDAYVRPWLGAFQLSVGLLALALFAFLAAAYLTLEATDDALREDFRRRALASGGVVFVASFGTLLLARSAAPLVWESLLRSAQAVPYQAATAVAAITTLAALWLRRWRLARTAVALQVALIVAGWGLAQYPYLLPPTLTVRDAAAPAVTLRLVLIALAAGAVVLFPSLAYLFRIFKSTRQDAA